MLYSTLGFALHKKCPASCSMCCFESNPYSKEELNLTTVRSYINQSKSIDMIKNISFTGGEPFLKYDELIELVLLAHRNSKNATCVTNGYWATSYDIAYKKLNELKQAGLTRISVSHDNYHKKFIQTSNIKHILNAAKNLNIPTTLAMVRIKNESMGNLINELGNSLYFTNLQIVPCLPVGGASKSFKPEEFDKTINTTNLKCIYSGNLAIKYDGSIYPCCSQEICNTCLSIGNFEDLSLREALEKIKNNMILYLLRNVPMDYFINIAKQNLNIEIPKYAVNPCEICAILFKPQNLKHYYPYIKDTIMKIKLTKAISS